MDVSFIRKRVKEGQYDLSAHAHQERQEEQITIAKIEKVLLRGDIIEKYPKDPRGESCLIGAMLGKESLHVICGTRDNRLLIVTVYRPKQPTWVDYKTRAKELKGRG